MVVKSDGGSLLVKEAGLGVSGGRGGGKLSELVATTVVYPPAYATVRLEMGINKAGDSVEITGGEFNTDDVVKLN
jgi:hypothetical protein